MELSAPVEFQTWVTQACGRKIILNAVEGWGKTSTVAHAEAPLMLMAPNETGYNRLAIENRVPLCPARLTPTWADLLASVRSVVRAGKFKTLALDAMSGLERLCHEHVCARDFDGDFGEKGFLGYGRGPDIAAREWNVLISALETVANSGIDVVILAHAKIKPFRNPLGNDYDRYVCDCHEKTWGVTHKWADAVLFGNFVDVVDGQANQKGKAKGGTTRQLFCERTAVFDAKNRFGMPSSLTIPNDPEAVWDYIIQNMKGTGNE